MSKTKRSIETFGCRSAMAGHERRFIPLLIVLSVGALFFFSYHHNSTLDLPNPNPNPNLSVRANPQRQPPQSSRRRDFTFIVKVLAYDRLDSLARCLKSLAAADYLADRVALHIFVDHFAALPNASSPSSSDQSDRRLRDSRRILEFADGFEWRFGEKIVHYRTQNAGLQSQWLEAWWPSSDDEFAFVVEDDLEVSPMYYKFLRSLILNYYYNEANFRPYIYGASLQRPRFVPGKHGNKIQLDNETRLFLYQLVGTWGQLLFPKPWKEFRLWYDEHKAKGIKPILDGMVTTGWYKRRGERIWTPWFIKFIHSRGYYNFYTSFSHERALSVSHRDPGVNYGKTAGPDSNLLDENALDFELLEMRPLSDLKWYDFCFREVRPERVVRRVDELVTVLRSVQKHEMVILVSLYGSSEIVLKNLLCNFEKLNISNHLFVGPETEFLLDLARRGHPVIVGDEFLRSVMTRKEIDFQDPLKREINIALAKVYAVQKCIELGYNSLVMEGNLVLTREYPHLEFDLASDFFAGKSSEILFIRSSEKSRKIWIDRKFIPNVASMMMSNQNERTSFVSVVAKLMEQMGVTIKSVDEMSLGVDIGTNNVSQFSLGVGKKMVFWGTKIGPNIVRKRLEELGLWMLDFDLSCKAVVCHHQS